MLKINLLPPYIYEGAKRRNVVVLWVLILIAVIGFAAFGKIRLDNDTKNWNDQTAAIDANANKADQTQAKANSIRSLNATTKAKADFVTNSTKYNVETYPPVFDNVNQYTINKVLYSGVIPSGNTVSVSAYAPSLADVGHYMLAMENNPNITNVSIAMNSIPGFGPGSGRQTGGGQTGGMGLPGFEGPQTGSAFGPGSSTGAFSASGFGGGNQQAAGVRPPGGAGHDFSATLALVKPIPGGPTYPSGGGGGGATPGFGGGGGPSMAGAMPGGGGMSGSGGAMSGTGGGGGKGKMGGE